MRAVESFTDYEVSSSLTSDQLREAMVTYPRPAKILVGFAAAAPGDLHREIAERLTDPYQLLAILRLAKRFTDAEAGEYIANHKLQVAESMLENTTPEPPLDPETEKDMAWILHKGLPAAVIRCSKKADRKKEECYE
jgi:hypothetical protein